MKKIPVTNYLKIGLILSVVFLPFAGAAPPVPVGVNDAPSEASVSEFTSANHSFSGLTLKGELKRPEFYYHAEKKGPRPEDLIILPKNFDPAIYQVTQER
jgi:hypothetical protein